jgi:hypothetical protein
MVDYELRVYHAQYSTLIHSIARVRTWIKITSSWDCCVVGPSVACRSTPQAPMHRHPGCESRHEGTAQHSFLFPSRPTLAAAGPLVCYCSPAHFLRRQHTTLRFVATLLLELCETETAIAIHDSDAILGKHDFAPAPATATREIARRRHGREQQDHDYGVRRRRMRYARMDGDMSGMGLTCAQEKVQSHCAWYAVNGRPTTTQQLVRALLPLRPGTAS